MNAGKPITPTGELPPGIVWPGGRDTDELVRDLLRKQAERDERLARARELGAAGDSARPLPALGRVEHYTAQNGVRRLTTRQARRLVKKQRREAGSNGR